jgi:hypothetical protein
MTRHILWLGLRPAFGVRFGILPSQSVPGRHFAFLARSPRWRTLR